MTTSWEVPVIDVQKENFQDLWPAMVIAIKTSSFIAVDTELSGLGNRQALLAESIEDRYKAICHAARSRSILSLGIACYKKQEEKAAETYMVQVYNLTLLCSEEYVIEPQSVQFLLQHGFDFNKQYGHGIPYCKGNNKGGSDDKGVHIRALFIEILRAKKPLVLHNGLIDMVFLYQCFYAHLPERLDIFTADLSEMFPAGIYDTKYTTEFELRLTASYLEYAYRKCKLENSRREASGVASPQVHIEFCQYACHMSSYVDYRLCPAVEARCSERQTDLCHSFSAFGWCPRGCKCSQSHDTDLIIFQDEKCKGDKKSKRKRKKEKKNHGENVAESSDTCEGTPEKKVAHIGIDEALEDQHRLTNEQSSGFGDRNGNVQSMLRDRKMGECDEAVELKENANSETFAKTSTDEAKHETGTHRAGFDAFMTGFIFAHTLCSLKKDERVDNKQEELWLPTCLNKIYLSGKAVPLCVVKSSFTKSSKAHMRKIEMLWGARV